MEATIEEKEWRKEESNDKIQKCEKRNIKDSILVWQRKDRAPKKWEAKTAFISQHDKKEQWNMEQSDNFMLIATLVMELRISGSVSINVNKSNEKLKHIKVNQTLVA